MSIRGVLVAGVYSVSIAMGGLAGGSAGPAGASLVASAEAPAPQSEAAGQRAAALPVRSTHIERRDAGSGLGPVMAAIAQHDAGPAWLAWTVPAVQHERHGSDERNRDWHRENTGCVLDDDGHFQNGSSTNGDTTTPRRARARHRRRGRSRDVHRCPLHGGGGHAHGLLDGRCAARRQRGGVGEGRAARGCGPAERAGLAPHPRSDEERRPGGHRADGRSLGGSRAGGTGGARLPRVTAPRRRVLDGCGARCGRRRA